MSWQEESGFPFDVSKAQKLESTLRTELDDLAGKMRDTFYWVPGKNMTPKRSNKTKGYVEGAEFCKLTEFNPTSRFHIGWAFQQFRGWEPTDFTDSGQPKIDESILKGIGNEEALAFARILELQKHLGQLSEGKNAWLKNVTPEGKLHHSCVLATNTGRMAHMRPNLAQVPSAHEYRELFYAGRNRVVVGADASGLELRCLGHYLAPFDGGQFASTVVNGDIHTDLAEIYGTDRKTGKGVTYCLIYGGGNAKLGACWWWLQEGCSHPQEDHVGSQGLQTAQRCRTGTGQDRGPQGPGRSTHPPAGQEPRRSELPAAVRWCGHLQAMGHPMPTSC